MIRWELPNSGLNSAVKLPPFGRAHARELNPTRSTT
jgi:hypothetical protein